MTTPFNVRPESWARLSALLDLAFDLDATERAALLAKTAAEDAELGAELARLLPGVDNNTMATSVPNAAPFTSLLNLALVKQASRDSTGATFGAWTLTDKIGQGGMGEVWRAVRSDGLFQGTAAIKILRSDLPADKLAARFARERAVLARLNHPNIARLLDAGVANDQAFIVLELVQGLPLLSYVATNASTVADRVRLIRDLARAVEHAHSQLVLHRDLKPSNVLVTENGSAKLLDFGIAAALDEATQNETTPNLTQLTGRGLTLEYAAPEQILGEPTVAASDVYSLGAMLFHLLTGQRPFAGNTNRAALEYAAVHTEAPRASSAVRLPPPGREGGGEGLGIRSTDDDANTLSLTLPPRGRGQNNSDQIAAPVDIANLKGDLDAIIAKTLRKSPSERYATATAFAADLDAWLAQTPISIRADDRSYRNRLWFKRNWKLAAISAVAITAVLAGLTVSLWQRNVAQTEAAKATAMSRYVITLFESADPEHAKGDKLSARDVLDAGAKSVAAQFASEPDTLAEMQAVFGRSYLGLSQPQTAIPLLLDAAAAAARKHGASAIEHARMLHLLARAYMETENFPEAERYSLASLDTLERVEGGTSEATVLGKINLAYAYQKQGNFALIAPLIAPVREAILRDLGDQHWLYAEIENTRAVAASAQGASREEIEALLAIEPLLQKPPVGKRSDALTIRANLAVAMVRGGRLAEALPRMDAIVNELTEFLGPDAERTLKTLWFAGEFLREAGRYADCAERYETLAERRVRVSGAASPLTVDAITKVAVCAQLSGDQTRATALAQRALALLPASDQPPQRTVLRTLLSLQMVMLDGASAAQAIALLPRTQALAAALSLPPNSREFFWLAAIEACAAARAGDVSAALQVMAKLAASAAYKGSPSARLLNAYLLALNDQIPAARAELTEARALATARFPSEHIIFHSIAHTEAMLDVPREPDRARAALEARVQRPVQTPLAPLWFGF